MPDQLSLELVARSPRLPALIRPMIARVTDEAFDSPDHLFEPSWGGCRALAFVEPDAETGALGLRLLDRDGGDIGPLFPELAGLPGALRAAFVVLDGEVIVPNGSGRADQDALEARLARGSESRLAGGLRARPEPAVYLAFDLLYRDGRPLVAQPLARRREQLASIVRPAAEILVVPAIPGEGRALFEAASGQRLHGILARHVRSPYLAGRESGLWRSIRTVATDTAPSLARPARGRSRTRGRTAADAPGAPNGEAETIVPGERAAGGHRPILALIRKLPLPFEGD